MTIRLLVVDDDPLVRAGLTFMFGGSDDLEIVGEAPTAPRSRSSPTGCARTWS